MGSSQTRTNGDLTALLTTFTERRLRAARESYPPGKTSTRTVMGTCSNNWECPTSVAANSEVARPTSKIRCWEGRPQCGASTRMLTDCSPSHGHASLLWQRLWTDPILPVVGRD